MAWSRFERIVDEALSDQNFATILEAAVAQLQAGAQGQVQAGAIAAGKEDFKNAVRNNPNLQFDLDDAEVDKMVGAIQDIDFGSFVRLARAFGDERAN